MHTILPFLLAMIAAIVLLEMLAAKLKVAYPILLVVAGLLISFIPGLPVVKVDPDMIFFILLPPLLFEASWSVSFKEMKTLRVLQDSLTLHIPLVLRKITANIM